MLEQFQTCTPVMALFRPWLSARSRNASRVAGTNARNCRSLASVSGEVSHRCALLKLGNSVIKKNSERMYFFADKARYGSQGTC